MTRTSIALAMGCAVLLAANAKAAEKFKQAPLQAKSIIATDPATGGTSGIHLRPLRLES